MRIPLDENIPLHLERELRARGRDVEHIILLGQRGCSDADIRRRLAAEELLFLTHDREFAQSPAGGASTVILSRVQQSLSVGARVRLWSTAIERFFEERPSARLLVVAEDGLLTPWAG